MALLALIGIYGSLKVGIGWGDDGPRAGFFPFYVSLVVLFSCAVNLMAVLSDIRATESCSRNGASSGRSFPSSCRPSSMSALVPYLGMYVSRRRC